jgi:hypothetical protein
MLLNRMENTPETNNKKNNSKNNNDIISSKNNNNIVSSKRNSRNNMEQMKSAIEFDYEPSYDYESLQLGSVELLFHYLRFKVFPDIPDEKKKQLFYILSYVGCREPEILKEIVNFAEKQEFEGLLEFAQTKKIQPAEFLELAQKEIDSCSTENNTNTAKKNTKVKVMFYKTPETMIDGWFLEDNPYLAYSLFQHLLFSQQEDKFLKSFLENYKSMPPEGRRQIVVYPKHGIVTI